VTFDMALSWRSSHTILVVEDEVLIRMDISDALRAHGFNILEAADASEAIRVLRSGVGVSLVLTDVRMPGDLDGVGLAKYVRANYPAIPCLITSALSVPDMSDLSPAPLIPKPYRRERVIEEIERHLPPRRDDRSSGAA
jgi:two-component system, response regulator PdtaR